MISIGYPLDSADHNLQIPGVEDYPKTIQEFEDRFSTEEKCRAYLVSVRWPEGFRCPHCPSSRAVMVRATLFQCCSCRRQTSATAGTIFQDTRKPLVMWFRAMWYVTSQKNGASALGLQRVLGLGSYETAWTWLHKLRRAMVRPDRDRLSGWVEVDETLVGGLEEGVAGRQTESKALVVIAAQADGPGIGRIRMRMIEDASAESLHPFVKDCIEAGSTIHTDGWQGYTGLDSKGYPREITRLRGRRKEASQLMPRVHRVASLLKRWLLGTHQGAVARQHLPYYLDEFTFRPSPNTLLGGSPIAAPLRPIFRRGSCALRARLAGPPNDPMPLFLKWSWRPQAIFSP